MGSYPLKIEILVDQPHGAAIERGQICKAKKDRDGDYHVYDPTGSGVIPYWAIMEYEALVIITFWEKVVKFFTGKIKCQSPQE